MLCAISGEAPQVPIASRKSGNVFEKRLIEAHIAEHHTDPVTGEDLTVEDLIELKSPRVVNPRPPTLTSIPSLLTAFQNEWDAIALETFTLKQQLAQTRQELSTALYQNDAATRVIARVTRERDEAREALSNVTVTGGRGSTVGNGDAMQVDNEELPAALAAKVDETQAHLTSTRRKRPIPEGWASSDVVTSLDVIDSTEPLYPGSTAIKVDESGDLALLGGADGAAGIFSMSHKKITQTLKVGSPITATAWWGSRAVIATSSGTVKVFENGEEISELGSHAGAATSLSVHPSGSILASAGVDKSFILYDLDNLRIATQIYTEAQITCCAFHPDGQLIAVGGLDGQIRIFSVKSGAQAGALGGEGSPLRSISFSENGTWLASAAKGSTSVSVWDLRKMTTIKVLDIGSPVDSVKWDYTGQFLATAGSGSVSVQQYTKSSKSWSEPLRKAVPARDVAWGANAASLLVLTPDGGLNLLGA